MIKRLLKHKLFLSYALTVGGFGAIIWWLLALGNRIASAHALPNTAVPATDTSLLAELLNGVHHPLSLLLLQIIAIIITARLFSLALKKIGQPTVVGEILAGIALGPSLLGMIFPKATTFLFPAESLGNLQFLSQIGLILFMFVIGLELDSKSLRHKAHKAFMISHVSITFSFLLGTLLAIQLYARFAPPGVHFTPFALFMGISMSITAFPVLARIIQERNLSRKPIGTLIITCAAIDDITAWCLLAMIIAIAKAGGILPALTTIAVSMLYIAAMFYIVKPFMRRVGEQHSSRELLGKPTVALVFVVLMISSWATEIIGIHALFGAFLAGVIMPEPFNFKRLISEKIEDIALVLFLPLLFVFTGLRTQIGLLNQPDLWVTCAAITGVAISGKAIGSSIATRLMGSSWKDAMTAGLLLNTRGLMELIVLNIAYDLGIINVELFTMLVLMALITTFMTGPALNLLEWIYRKKTPVSNKQEVPRLLLSFGRPATGPSLLKIAHMCMPPGMTANYMALHISPQFDILPEDASIFEDESFTPIKTFAQTHQIPIKTHYRATEDVANEIIHFAHGYRPDIMIMGAGQLGMEKRLLGGKLGRVIRNTQSDLLIFSDKDMQSVHQIVVIYQSNMDITALRYAKLIAQSQEASLKLVHLSKTPVDQSKFAWLSDMKWEITDTISPELLAQADLVVIGNMALKTAAKFSDVPLRDWPSTVLVYPTHKRPNPLFALPAESTN